MALELPQRLRNRLDESLRRSRADLPRARWVRSENLHLTLAFLGETPEERMVDLERALKPVFGSRSGFSLELSECGAFPKRGRARVAWIGFADCPELLDLESALRSVLERDLGHALERRPFHPHLTVARCSPPWPVSAAEAWRDRRPDGLGDGFEVERGVLMESRLGPGGARYSVAQAYPMGGA